MFMIVLLVLLIALLVLVLFRTPPTPPTPVPATPPLPARHVSFSLAGSDTSSSLPASPSAHRRWSAPFHRRRSLPSDSPCTPHPHLVDQFGSSPPATHPFPKSPKRLFTPPRFSLPNRWRSSSVCSTSTPTPLDTRPPSPPPPRPLRRTRFVNPFKKHFRSRTLSPPSTLKSPDSSSTPSAMSSPSPPLQGRRSLVNKFKTVFKSMSPEPSPVILSKPIVSTVHSRLRRKPAARTQPYGPPWNAPMPVPEFDLSQHSLQKHANTMSPFPQTNRKHLVHESSSPEHMSMLPHQTSPCTFINELGEKLSLLQQQRIQDLVPSSHE